MSTSIKPSFGFEGLSDIQPTPAPSGQGTITRQIDQVADRLGFTSREGAVRRKRRTSDEPTDQLNLRAAIPDINRFVEWCERNRYSYREGFAELVKLIDRI
jgi:hypothetical protein